MLTVGLLPFSVKILIVLICAFKFWCSRDVIFKIFVLILLLSMQLLVPFWYVSSNSSCFLLKVEAHKHLEAFSIQLVILAIWKQALDICHTQAASAIEGSPNQETIRSNEIMKKGQVSLYIKEHLDATNMLGPENVCSHIEKAFLGEVGSAEELAKHIEPGIFSD